ncbi:RNA 2',3'-cyclic phosphodiesterase [Haloferax namakaokahaiae]|uniref:RNA 2',3'-cyclic phosphodiesterase n=1 Tax=Haloferax namakaokahaiae TaxID=1748331 RepID=A0ABD5ZIF9_9EURY
MRLFLAIDLPASLSREVADAQALFADADGLRFTNPKQAHITLKFLGETPPDQLRPVADAVETAIDEAGVEPFDASLGGLGAFPSLDYIRVVWTGVRDGAREMVHLHDALDPELATLGFEPDERDFSPHLTLARMNDARSKTYVREVIEDEAPELGSFRVREIRVKKSDLTAEGPNYETVARCSL